MYVGLKQPLGDGERCVTPARAAAKETKRIKHHYSRFRDRHASDFIAKFPWDS